MFGRHFDETDMVVSKVNYNDLKSTNAVLILGGFVDLPHFQNKNNVNFTYFQISRESIDACKNYFRDDLQKSDWQLMVELKKTFEIL